MDTPTLSQHLHLLQRVEDLSIQKLVAQLRVETFAVTVLPRRAGFDVQRLGSYVRQPLPQLLSYELRPIVRADMLGDSMLHHGVGHNLDYVPAVQPASGTDGQALSAVLIDLTCSPKSAHN